jgi:hypothetical protein
MTKIKVKTQPAKRNGAKHKAIAPVPATTPTPTPPPVATPQVVDKVRDVPAPKPDKEPDTPLQFLEVPVIELRAAALAATKDDVRKYLQGVFIVRRNGAVELVSTNGRRLQPRPHQAVHRDRQ